MRNIVYSLNENGQVVEEEKEIEIKDDDINSFEVSATSRKIVKLKQTLQKYKEDVEQVELFKMQRDDYEEKIQLCANIVLQLRELEAQLNQPTNN